MPAQGIMGAMPHKLLLADDSVTIQRVIELTFADEDVQVIAVGNGKDAIESVQRDRPDIVLADAGMPERDGYEVAAFIKGQPAYAHIPVVLLTGAFEPVDEARAKSVGCDGVLVKPFEPQIVISRVKDLLAGKRPAGMWGAAPVAQGPVRQAPPAEPDRRRSSTGGDSLEAYFDHLDAAFASAGSGDPATLAPFAPPAAAAKPFDSAQGRPSDSAQGRPSESAQSTRETGPSEPRSDSVQPASRSGDPFGDWDPDLRGKPAKPAVPEPSAALQQKSPVPDARPVPASPPVASAAPAAPTPAVAALPPSLVDAFAALLAAEQKMGLTPSAATVPQTDSRPTPAAAPAEELVEEVSRRVLARLTDQSRHTILDVAERMVREEIERIKSIG
jgi:CheY-like chemotaxis protein